MLLRVIILVPWCVFWGFMMLTSYFPPVRRWWQQPMSEEQQARYNARKARKHG